MSFTFSVNDSPFTCQPSCSNNCSKTYNKEETNQRANKITNNNSQGMYTPTVRATTEDKSSQTEDSMMTTRTWPTDNITFYREEERPDGTMHITTTRGRPIEIQTQPLNPSILPPRTTVITKQPAATGWSPEALV